VDLDQSKALEDHKLEGQRQLEALKFAYVLRTEEFKSLRSEIEFRTRDNRSTELYVIGGLVAYYAWLMTHCIPSDPILIMGYTVYSLPWLIPMALPLIGVWRVSMNFLRISEIASYIILLTSTLPKYIWEKKGSAEGPDGIVDLVYYYHGWEHFVQEKRKTKGIWRVGPHVIIWVALFSATIAAPSVGMTVNARLCSTEQHQAQGPGPARVDSKH
jgi:hypothetical protein